MTHRPAGEVVQAFYAESGVDLQVPRILLEPPAAGGCYVTDSDACSSFPNTAARSSDVTSLPRMPTSGGESMSGLSKARSSNPRVRDNSRGLRFRGYTLIQPPRPSYEKREVMSGDMLGIVAALVAPVAKRSAKLFTVMTTTGLASQIRAGIFRSHRVRPTTWAAPRCCCRAKLRDMRSRRPGSFPDGTAWR